MSNALICKTCGEEVQKGVVRCWNCQSFMREDIEQAYLKKQASPPPVLLSDPEAEGTVVDHTQGHSTPTAPIETIPLATEEPSIAEEEVVVPEPKIEENQQPEEKPDPPQESDTPEADSGAAESQEGAADEHHSVKTAGDELLAAAMAEEKEVGNKQFKGALVKPTPKTKGGFIVFCPNGHPIEVQQRHRGKVGKCPKCREPFNVPVGRSLPATDEDGDNEADGTSEPVVEKPEFLWMEDVHLHEVDLQKLSIKPGSLEKQFKEIDIRISQEELLFLTLVKSAGMFAKTSQKRPEVRKEVLENLSKNVPASGCGAAEHFQMNSPEKLSIVQPVVEGEDSLFAGIPIFGEGRIAVLIPRAESGTQRTYLSFSLSEFRKFSDALDQCCDIVEFGIECGIPLEDLTMEKRCHYTNATFDALENIEYYKKDPALEIEISGRECKECGLELSEEGRKKESIGGKAGKGIAKAKCPKCTKKFGDMTHYRLK